MFNPPPAHGNPDSPAIISLEPVPLAGLEEARENAITIELATGNQPEQPEGRQIERRVASASRR